MKYDLNRNEYIEAYINGELSQAENEAFEKQINSDPRIKSEVAQFRYILKGLEQLRQKELLKKDFAKWDAIIDANKKKKVIPLKWFYAAAASVLLVVCFSIFQKANSDGKQLFASYYEAYPNVVTPITRSTDANLNDTEKLMYLYEAGDYAAAIPLMEAHHNTAQWDFYLGISYLAEKQTNKAIDRFLNIDKNSDFYSQAKWYLALSYVKKGEMEEANTLLKEIVTAKSFQYQNAALLLEEI